jgi:transcriptional regulator with XRE-family HTH domain
VPQLTPEERTRVGQLLRELRRAQTPLVKQAHIAQKIGCAIATVQAIEYNKYRVDRDTIEQYAAVFNTTIHQLLHPESTPIVSADPRFADLNYEHLKIARRYMRAVDVVRVAVKLLLSETASDALAEEFAELVLWLKRASEATRDPGDLTFWMRTLVDRPQVLQDLARRLDTEPGFEAKLLDIVNEPPPKGKK